MRMGLMFGRGVLLRKVRSLKVQEQPQTPKNLAAELTQTDSLTKPAEENASVADTGPLIR